MTTIQTTFGGHSMFAPLRRVLLRRPNQTFANADPVHFHYTRRPDLARALEEHAMLEATLREAGAKVEFHDQPLEDLCDSIYVFDPTLITERGVIVLRPGKALRQGEETALARRLNELGLPTWFALEGNARAEGGDMFWLDATTLAVGRGFRTNQAGIEQLSAGLATEGIEVLAFDLPYFHGQQACLHLLSVISLVDRDLAVVYPPLVPVSLWQLLEQKGLTLVRVDEHEFATQAPNVLALGPRKVLMLEGNESTRAKLEAADCEVLTYRGEEISLTAEGGPTCLTLPLQRG